VPKSKIANLKSKMVSICDWRTGLQIENCKSKIENEVAISNLRFAIEEPVRICTQIENRKRCVSYLAFLSTKQQIELSKNLMEDALVDAAEPFDDYRLAQGVDLVGADQAFLS